jgi:MFS transporter, PAT family, beta-lactamase induction signal transducer AmpG
MRHAQHFRRLSSVLLLAFSSGLPLALVGGTLQMMYISHGFSKVQIGQITLLSLPYTLKFLWAPIMDRFVPMRLGRRRSWILLTQFLLICGLILMSMLPPSHTNSFLLLAALFVAFMSASQDISIDAYRTDVLQPSERGMGASLNTVGYRFAMLVSGAFAVALAVKTSWQYSYLLMAVLLLVCMFATYFTAQPKELSPPKSMRQAVIEPVHNFLQRDHVLALIFFILIYKLCDAFALSLSSLFLVRGVGFSIITVANTTKFVGLAASLLGAIAGGMCYKKIGLWRALFLFGVLQTASNGTYLLLALTHKSYITMCGAVFIEFFCSGISAVAFVAFLMSLCNHKYTAAQYAIFSALAALAHAVIGPFAGVFASHYSWAIFYSLSIVLGLPALFMLLWMKNKIDFDALGAFLPTD